MGGGPSNMNAMIKQAQKIINLLVDSNYYAIGHDILKEDTNPIGLT